MKTAIVVLTLATLVVASCQPRLQRVVDNREVLPDRSGEAVAQARATEGATQARLADEAAERQAAALATCAGERCAAVAAGELRLGMSEAELLAATRTTPDAWERRGDGEDAVYIARPGMRAPSDAAGELAFVALQGGAVASYTYREPQGFRTVASAADETASGRAAARADAMLREGDDLALRGDFVGALNRYDRADVLRPAHAETTLRIAQALDKQLRPVEAALRYRLFIHQLELEKIEARGVVAANIAEAIARARERVVILEQR